MCFQYLNHFSRFQFLNPFFVSHPRSDYSLFTTLLTLSDGNASVLVAVVIRLYPSTRPAATPLLGLEQAQHGKLINDTLVKKSIP